MVGEFGDQDPAFEIPVYRFRSSRGYIASDEGANAVDFPAEAGGVVFVTRETEVGVVEAGGGADGVIVGERSIDGAAEGGERGGVAGSDFDFL